MYLHIRFIMCKIRAHVHTSKLLVLLNVTIHQVTNFSMKSTYNFYGFSIEAHINNLKDVWNFGTKEYKKDIHFKYRFKIKAHIPISNHTVCLLIGIVEIIPNRVKYFISKSECSFSRFNITTHVHNHWDYANMSLYSLMKIKHLKKLGIIQIAQQTSNWKLQHTQRGTILYGK